MSTQICKPNCVVQRPPVLSQNCQITVKPGGINRLFFALCGVQNSVFDTPGWFNQAALIKEAICGGYLFFTGEILGQKPKGSVTRKRISSCKPELVIAGTKTVTFQDYNSYDPVPLEDDANYEVNQEYLFWDFIDQFQAYLTMGFVTCDGRVFFVDGEWNLEIDEVIEETKDDTSFMEGTLTIQKKSLIFGYANTAIPDTLAEFNPDEDCTPYDYIFQQAA